MRRFQAAVSAFIVIIALIACGEVSTNPRHALVATLEHNEYYAGEEVTFELRNISKHDIELILCPLSLEQLKDGIWSRSPNQPAVNTIVCPTTPTVFPSGETYSGTFALQVDVPVGTYRILLLPRGDRVNGRPIPSLVTPVFSIIADS